MMSDATTKEPTESQEINADSVLVYLKNNPDFLRHNPAAIDLLIPPKANGDGIVDFRGYMIERLKADKESVLSTTQEIVETTRANMNNQKRIHTAVLRLLESQSFEDYIHTITMDLASFLDIDIVVLLVETDTISHVQIPGIRLIPGGTVDNWMQEKQVLLQDHISGIEAIYGGGATLVNSQLLLRIDVSMDTPPAILAFGSRNPQTFAEGQATDQILFLARVIERTMRKWLYLP